MIKYFYERLIWQIKMNNLVNPKEIKKKKIEKGEERKLELIMSSSSSVYAGWGSHAFGNQQVDGRHRGFHNTPL